MKESKLSRPFNDLANALEAKNINIREGRIDPANFLDASLEELEQVRGLAGENATKDDYYAAHELIKEEKWRPLHDLYDDRLKNKVNRVPDSMYLTSRLVGVKGILLRKPNHGESEPPSQPINVILYFDHKEKDKVSTRWFTFTLGGDGEPYGINYNRPPELKHLEDREIYEEAIRIAGNYTRGSRWMQIPEYNIPPEKYLFPKGDGEPPREGPFDDDRINFFQTHPNCLLSMFPEKEVRGGGVREYCMFLFPKGVIFENRECRNRLFHYLFDKKLDDQLIDRIIKDRVSRSEYLELFDQLGVDTIRSFNKTELKGLGLGHSKHPDMELSKETSKYWQSIDELIKRELV